MLEPGQCLAASEFVDSDDAGVIEFALRAAAGAGVGADARARAVAIFLKVRDGFRYDPYNTLRTRASYRASSVVATSANWCVPKSVLLTAACRAAGIPAALGFADVRNHLQSEKLKATMTTDVFAWHGYSLVWLDDGWQKVSSAFNIELCERFGTKVLDWDGTGDALMHPFDNTGNRHMEYVLERGTYLDVPFDDMQATFAELYPDFAPSSDPVNDPMFNP